MIIPYFIAGVFSVIYVFMQTLSVYAGDSGELVASAYTWSVAHPPGYPLYMLLGAVFSHSISFSTVAWRIGLLSSLPMAISLLFLWKSIALLTRSRVSATLTTLCCGFLYPVWLYAIVPEVFGLFALFSSILLYVFLMWVETKRSSYLYLLSFISGLALTHHHLILLLLLGILGFIIQHKNVYAKMVWSNIWKLLGLGLLGFSFYAYAPLVSARYPPFDWEHAANLSGFLRLLTRASYGTFKASQSAGQSLLDRFMNILTFFQYAWKDFSPVGISFIAIGIVGLWKTLRRYFLFFSIYIGLQLFYFFYAGFPISSDFSLGTLERFFIVPYLTISIVMGIGCSYILKKNNKYVHIPYGGIVIMLCIIVSLIAIRSIRKNYSPLALLRTDTTIENLADDILASVPPGGILSLSHDTSVFAVNYAYNVQKKRSDIRYVYFPQLQYYWYREGLRKRYPDIIVPTSPTPLPYDTYLKLFIDANVVYRPILDEDINITVVEHWVPRGLVFMYYPTLSAIPNRESILEKNQALWKSFHDPLQGILGVYRHLLMSDTLRYYAYKRSFLAESYLYRGDMEALEREMAAILRYDPNERVLYLKFLSLLADDASCVNAYALLQKINLELISKEQYLPVMHKFYTACLPYQESLQQYENEYQDMMHVTGTKIE